MVYVGNYKSEKQEGQQKGGKRAGLHQHKKGYNRHNRKGHCYYQVYQPLVLIKAYSGQKLRRKFLGYVFFADFLTYCFKIFLYFVFHKAPFINYENMNKQPA